MKIRPVTRSDGDNNNPNGQPKAGAFVDVDATHQETDKGKARSKPSN